MFTFETEISANETRWRCKVRDSIWRKFSVAVNVPKSLQKAMSSFFFFLAGTGEGNLPRFLKAALII